MQSMSVWCWFQDGDLWRNSSPCSQLPHCHCSLSNDFSTSLSFCFNLLGTCGNLADLQYPQMGPQFTLWISTMNTKKVKILLLQYRQDFFIRNSFEHSCSCRIRVWSEVFEGETKNRNTWIDSNKKQGSDDKRLPLTPLPFPAPLPCRSPAIKGHHAALSARPLISRPKDAWCFYLQPRAGSTSFPPLTRGKKTSEKIKHDLALRILDKCRLILSYCPVFFPFSFSVLLSTNRFNKLHTSGMYVARIWDLPHTLRTSVAQKSVACICPNDLPSCAHECPKRPLCTSVSEITLACIRFHVTKNQCLDPNFNFYYLGFTTEHGPDRRHR